MSSAAPARQRRRTSGIPPLRGLLPLVVLLVLWQLLVSPDDPYFPPPSRWFAALGDLGTAGALWPSIFTTLLSFVLALVIAVVVGAALGVGVGRAPVADRVLGPTFEFIRTIPAGAMVPVAVLVIGYTRSMTVAVVVVTSLWPVLLATRAAARELDVARLEAARVMHLGRFETFRKIVLPSLSSSIVLGLQITAPLALIITIVVELITQVDGIGKQISLAQSQFQSETVYGLVAVTCLIGLAVNLVAAVVARATRRYVA
ncbi:ABC transporter permease subunit [Nocardia sp. NPDC049220]|uniref:ABC transporter permease n=1 Tax=Nocardia sp. NPDC049220 TaxID=3155273 RepID=UPI0033E9ECA1